MKDLGEKGFRILGLGYRELEKNEILNKKRELLEKDLRFLGFLVLQNKLKEDTFDCIKRLKEGNIDCKIISGDNILTTIHASLECGIME